MKSTTLITGAERETVKLGEKIAAELKPGDVLALFGNLGSGKTTLTRGIARGLGVKQNEVSSPSFVLVKEYQGRMPIYHIDLYRLDNYAVVEREGFADYLDSDGVSVIEWAERMEELLPRDYLRINLEIKDRNKRKISLIAVGRRYRELVKKLKI